MTLALSACGTLNKLAEEKAAPENPRIGFMTQEYIGDNIAEIPYIEYDGETNPEIESINRSLNQGIQQVYDGFMETADEDAWIEIKSYPFTSERFLQAVVTHVVYPTYGTDGDMLSVNYDKVSEVWLSTEAALEYAELRAEDLVHNVTGLFEPEYPSQSVGEVKVSGFLVHEYPEEIDGDSLFIEFLLEITVENSEAEPWKSFYSYTPRLESLFRLNSSCLFDPFDMDQADPPLFYQTTGE